MRRLQLLVGAAAIPEFWSEIRDENCTARQLHLHCHPKHLMSAAEESTGLLSSLGQIKVNKHPIVTLCDPAVLLIHSLVHMSIFLTENFCSPYLNHLSPFPPFYLTSPPPLFSSPPFHFPLIACPVSSLSSVSLFSSSLTLPPLCSL